MLAPVIIFNYNRPDHSLQVWDALSHNELAVETELYLYCDGPKEVRSDGVNELTNERIRESNARVEQTQALAKQYARDAEMKGLFKAVHVVCSEKNKGLANSIISGVSNVIAKYGRVIVLEDDLLSSPYFLNFMNMALDKYESYPAVFSIGGYNYPPPKIQIPKDYPYDAYVSVRCCSWGWATWKEEWERIDWSLDYMEEFLNQPEQIKAFNRGGDDLTNMLLLQRDHKIDSWAIRYAFQHFYHHAVTILPSVSYVDNIGCDGTGVHCADIGNEIQNDVSLAPRYPRLPNTIYEDRRIINAFYNCYCRDKRPFWQRVINTVYRKFGKSAPFVIKKKVYCE